MTKLKKTQSNESLKKAISHLNLDMTMEELGKKLEYSKAAVSKYLGGFPPSKAFLLKFEEVFSVNLKDFENEDPEPSTGTHLKTNAKSIKQNEMIEIEVLKELVLELKGRVADLKESLETEKEYKEYFKKKYESIKTEHDNDSENNNSTIK